MKKRTLCYYVKCHVYIVMCPKSKLLISFLQYHIPNAGKRFEGHFGLDEKFIDLAMEMSEIVEEGFNFLHVEASETFVATDSNRVTGRECLIRKQLIQSFFEMLARILSFHV